MVLNVVGSNPIGHPSSNPLQLCVVRDFFCLSTSSPSPSLLSARSTTVRQDSGSCPLSVRSLSSCHAFVVAAVCVERLLLIGKVSLAYLPALARAPMPVAAENALPRFIVVCEAEQIVCLGGEVMPRRRCVSRKDCRDLSKRILARGSACAHRIFRFLPSPFTYLYKVQ